MLTLLQIISSPVFYYNLYTHNPTNIFQMSPEIHDQQKMINIHLWTWIMNYNSKVGECTNYGWINYREATRPWLEKMTHQGDQMENNQNLISHFFPSFNIRQSCWESRAELIWIIVLCFIRYIYLQYLLILWAVTIFSFTLYYESLLLPILPIPMDDPYQIRLLVITYDEYTGSPLLLYPISPYKPYALLT